MCPPLWWLRTQVRPYKTGNYCYSYERNLVLAGFQQVIKTPGASFSQKGLISPLVPKLQLGDRYSLYITSESKAELAQKIGSRAGPWEPEKDPYYSLSRGPDRISNLFLLCLFRPLFYLILIHLVCHGDYSCIHLFLTRISNNFSYPVVSIITYSDFDISPTCHCLYRGANYLPETKSAYVGNAVENGPARLCSGAITLTNRENVRPFTIFHVCS
jgi:hypothetical protein